MAFKSAVETSLASPESAATNNLLSAALFRLTASQSSMGITLADPTEIDAPGQPDFPSQ